ncbi:MAG: PAS domain-containing protein [Dehalococcoidia bacterium]
MVRNSSEKPSVSQVSGSEPATASNGASAGSSSSDSVLVAELARRALTRPAFSAVLEDAVGLVRTHLRADFAMVLELVPNSEGFLLSSGVGWRPGYVGQVVVPLLPGSEVAHAIGQSGPVVTSDLRNEARFTPSPFLLEHHIDSSAETAIRDGDRVFGILSAHTTKRREFSEGDQNFLASVAAVLAAAFARRDTEHALLESGERLKLAMEAGGMGAWEWRVPTAEVIWSESLERIHGLEPGTFGGDFAAYQRDIHPDDRERAAQTIQQSLQEGSHYMEYRIIRPDGDVRWLAARGLLLRDSRGEPSRMIGVCSDITERKQSTEERDRLFAEIRSAETRYRSLFTGVADTIVLTNSRGQCVDVNPAASELLGYSIDEMKLMHISEVVVRGLQWSDAEFRHFVAAGEWKGEVLLRRKDGGLVDVEVKATIIHLPIGPIFVAAVRDITERKRTEISLARSARQQAAVAQLGVRALSESNLQELLDEAAVLIASTLDLEYAEILELLAGGDALLLRAGAGWQEGLVGLATIGTGEDSQAGYTLMTDGPVVVEDAGTEQRFTVPNLFMEHNAVSGMTVVIRLRDRVFGVLGAHTKEKREFTSEDINFLQSIANILAVALERHETAQELQRLVFQLEMERQRVDNLVSNVPGVVWESFGEPGKGEQPIDFVSQHVEKMLGYSVEEWLSTPNLGLSIIHPDDRDRAAAETAAIFESGGSGRSEFRMIAKDGTPVWVEAQSTVVRNADGKPIGMRGVTMDITERRLADDRLREYAHTLETINRINLSLSGELELEQIVQGVTDALTELTGAQFGAFFYNLVDAEGERYQLFTISGVPREEFENFSMPRNTGIFRPAFAGERIVRYDDVTKVPEYDKSEPYFGMPGGHGPVRSYLAVPVVSRFGGVHGGILLGHSEAGVFGEREEQVATGLAAQTAIAMDNALLFRQSQETQEELRRANEAKDEFLGLVSHELRTPITTIFGGARLLRSRSDRLDAESRNEILEDIERESERLHRIVEDLLVLARMELGQELATEPLLVRRIVERTIATFTKRRPGRPVEYQTDDQLAPVRGSAVYIDQILRNLLNNADKYSPPGLLIDVWVRRDGDELKVSVMDRGPGIAEAEFNLIFERFYRSSGTASQASGAGIGLTVCQRLVEAQSGRIWAEARDGGGLVISFALPVYSE